MNEKELTRALGVIAVLASLGALSVGLAMSVLLWKLVFPW